MFNASILLIAITPHSVKSSAASLLFSETKQVINETVEAEIFNKRKICELNMELARLENVKSMSLNIKLLYHCICMMRWNLHAL